MSSLAAIADARNLTAYKSSKAAVNALTQSLALTGATHGIRANAIMPGVIDAPMGVDGLRDRPRPLRRRARRHRPLGRQGTAWDVASAARFLASDEAAVVTGVVLPVDGGQSARVG